MSPIIVKYREGLSDKPDWWEVYRPIIDNLSDGTAIVIPAGYVTDFASVPPLLWSLFPPIGKYNRAALIHDYLYDCQFRQKQLGERIARKFADEQFLHFANLVNPKGRIKHFIMYKMIRLFGRKAWRASKY